MNRINQTYLMLIVSAFTFFGLSAIHNASYFTNFFGENKIELTIVNEEESESSNEVEVKEAKSYQNFDSKDFANTQFNNSTSIAFQELLLHESTHFFEVSTPPPELL